MLSFLMIWHLNISSSCNTNKQSFYSESLIMQFFFGIHPDQYPLIEKHYENTHFLTVEKTDFLWIRRDIFDVVYLPMDYFLNVLGVEEIPDTPLLMKHDGKITVDAPFVISGFQRKEENTPSLNNQNKGKKKRAKNKNNNSYVFNSTLELVRSIIKTVKKHNDAHVDTPCQQIHSIGFYQDFLFEHLNAQHAQQLVSEIALMMDAVN